ncbi:hypothetical protein BLOT_005531 [Blomia tropicalis]|nr:hypothetical protein BLOT_005531 [Blomia tropicalis]
MQFQTKVNSTYFLSSSKYLNEPIDLKVSKTTNSTMKPTFLFYSIMLKKFENLCHTTLITKIMIVIIDKGKN